MNIESVSHGTIPAGSKRISPLDNLEVDNMPEVQSVKHLEELLNLPQVVLFKHSLTCPISAVTYSEVAGFFAERPGIPAYVIPVQKQRSAATAVEKKTGVRHESPQFLLIRDGEVVKAASHFAITGRLLSELFPSEN